jgi:hypothetical protein
MFVAAVLAGWLWVLAHPAAASQFMGEYTWTIHQTLSEDGPMDETYTMIIGLSKVSGTYYQAQGRIIIPPSTLFMILSGGGLMVGDNLLFSFHYVRYPSDPDRSEGMVYFQINKTTGNGTFYHLGTNFDTAHGTFNNSFGSGEVTISGKVPVFATSASAFPLLLLE